MVKAEIVRFSVAVIVCDKEMQSTSTAMNAKDQGYLETLGKGHFG